MVSRNAARQPLSNLRRVSGQSRKISASKFTESPGCKERRMMRCARQDRRTADVHTKQSRCTASGIYAPRSDSGINCAGPNTVIRSGQGPQFASAAGPGSQTAISNSGPATQQTSIGQNSFPSPNNIFGTGTGMAVYP